MSDQFDDELDGQNFDPVSPAPAPVRPVAASPFTRGRGNRAPVGQMVSQAERFVQNQEVAQARADNQQATVDRKRNMAALEDQMIRKGLDYYKGEDGMLRPKRDESGAVLYKEGEWAKAQLPDGAWGYQRRGRNGKPETKRANLVTGGDTDPNLYYDFGAEGREAAGHVDDLVTSKDPQVSLEAQKHRTKWASAQRKAAMKPLDDQLTTLEQERAAAEVQRGDLSKQQQGLAAKRAELQAQADALKAAGKWTKGWLSKELTSEAAPLQAQLDQVQTQETILLTQADGLSAPWRKTETETGPKAQQLAALKAEREAWEAESKLAAYADVAEERRAVLKKLGRSEADDPILKEIAKVQEQFGVRAKGARVQSEEAKRLFPEQKLDIGDVYLRGKPEEAAADPVAQVEEQAQVKERGSKVADLGLSLLKGGQNVFEGLDTLVADFTPAGWLYRKLVGRDLRPIQAVADTAGAVAGAVVNAAEGRGDFSGDVLSVNPGEGRSTALADAQSSDLKRRRADSQKAVAAAGEGKEGFDKFISQFGTAFREGVSDPVQFANTLAEQAAMLIPSSAAAGLAAKLAPAAKAAQAAKLAAIGAGAVMQGADVADDTKAEIGQVLAGMSAEEASQVPGIAEYLAAGKTLEQAKAQFLVDEARKAFAIGAGASAAVNALPGNVEDIIGRMAAGQVKDGAKGGAKAAVKGAAKAAVVEPLTEIPEEVAGRVAVNRGVQQVDPSRSLDDGLGETAGQAAAGAIGTGAAVGGIEGGTSRGRAVMQELRKVEKATEQVRVGAAEQIKALSLAMKAGEFDEIAELLPQARIADVLAQASAAVDDRPVMNGKADDALALATASLGRVAAFGDLVTWAADRMASTRETAQQIRAIPDFAPVLPEGTDPVLAANEAVKVKTANRDAATALVKIGNGLPVEALTEGEQQGLALVGEAIGSAMVDFSAGGAVITDKARTWLSDLAPASAKVLDRTETQQREAVKAQVAAAQAPVPPTTGAPAAQAQPQAEAQQFTSETPGLQLNLTDADLSGPVQPARVLRSLGRADSSARGLPVKSKTLVARATSARVNRMLRVFRPIFGDAAISDDAVGSGGFTVKGGKLNVHLGDLAHSENADALLSDARLATLFTEEAAHVVSLKLEADGQWDSAAAWSKLTPEEQRLFSAAYLRDQQGKPRAAGDKDSARVLAHETVRMFVQGRARVAQDGKVIVDGKTTEQTASRGLLAMLRDVLSKIQALLSGSDRGSEGAQELRAVADRIGAVMEQLVGAENFAYGDTRTSSAAVESAQPRPAPDNSQDEKAAPAAAEASLAGEKINREWTAFSDDSQSLGIPRALMPQIKAEARGALTQFLLARGITHTQEEVLPGSLKPTQAEFSPSKVAKAREFTGGDRAILVSADNHVVDGHHQWMAKLTDKPSEPMRVIRLNAPIRDILNIVPAMPTAETAGGATKDAPKVDFSLGAAKLTEAGPRAAMQVSGDSLTDESRAALAAELGIAPGQIGDVETVTHKGRVFHTVNVVANAEAFPTSHNPDGTIRGDYPQDLQPRDRSGDVYLAQQRQMAANPNLNEEALKGTTDRGVPIVAIVDGAPVVVMGNGRANAKRLMYESAQLAPVAQKFAADVAPIAARKGVDAGAVASVQRPVLYRVALDAMPVESLREASQESNEFAGAATNAVEQARQDAGRLTPTVLSFLTPGFDLAASRNTPFRQEFVRSVIGSRAANITEGDLVRRIEAALFAKAYSGSPEGAQAFSRLLNDDDAGVKSLIGGMMEVAPAMSAMNTAIEEGALHPLRISDDVARAVEDIAVTLRDKPSSQTTATALDGLLNQGEMAGITERTALQGAVLRFLVENRNNKGKIVAALRNYIQLVRAEGDPKQASMFGEAAVRGTEELWKDAVTLSADEALASARSRVAGRLDDAIELASGRGSPTLEEYLRESKAQAAEARRQAMAPAVAESQRILSELEAFKKQNADKPYVVVDTKTGEVVYRTTYKFKGRARGYAEKRNQEWGAFRYTSRMEDAGLSSGRSRRPADATGDLFAAMGLEGDAKLYGETVPAPAKESLAAFVKQAAQDIPSVRGDLKTARDLAQVAAPDFFLTAADEGQDAPDAEADAGQASPEGQQSNSPAEVEDDAGDEAWAETRATELENDPNADEPSAVADVEPLEQDEIRAHEAKFGADDTLAPEDLFEKYRPAAERLAAVRFANVPGATKSELMQQARLVLWEAVSGVSAFTQKEGNKKFTDYGVGKQGTKRTFWQYAGNILRRRLATMFTGNVRDISRKVSMDAGSVGLEGETGGGNFSADDTNDGGGTIGDYLESGDDVAATAERDDAIERAREALRSAMAILGDREVKALTAFMTSDRGGMLKAVQEATGVNSIQHASIILAKAQQRLKEVLDSRGFDLGAAGLASGRSGLPPPPAFALRNTDPARWQQEAEEWAAKAPDVLAFRSTTRGEDALFTSKNTREGEKPWRVTIARKWSDGMRPLTHVAFPTRGDAFKYALSQGEPDEALLFSLPANVKTPEGRDLWAEQLHQLASGLGGDGGPFAKIGPKTIPIAPGGDAQRTAKKWLDVMPAFQGGKYQMAEPAAEAIARTFTKEQREKIDTVFDYFGGGGMWGGYLALTHFPNAKRLVVHELDPIRAAKIELYHRQGDKIAGLLDSPEGKALLEAVTAAASGDGTTSGTAVAARMRAFANTHAGNADMLGVIGALTDAAMNARGRAKDKSGTKTAEATVEKVRAIAIRDAADAFKGAQALRERGVAFELRQGDSYAGEVAQGDNVLSVMDPPYYLTTGYDGGIVPLGVYQKTSDMIDRLSKAGNAIIYTDSAWWIDNPEKLAATGGLFTGGVPEDQAALGTIVDSINNLGTVGLEGRHEVLGIKLPGSDTSPVPDRRAEGGAGLADRGSEPRQREDGLRREGAADVQSAERLVGEPARETGADQRRAPARAAAPVTPPPPPAKPPVAAAAAPAPGPAPIGDQAAIDSAFRELRAQLPGGLDEIRANQRFETDGTRIQGRPDLANPGGADETARNAWNAVDEARKPGLQVENREEARVEAERMVAADRSGVLRALLEKARRGEAFGSTVENYASLILANDLVRKGAMGDAEAMEQAAILQNAHRESRANVARILGAGADVFKKPEDRIRDFLAGSLFTPNPQVRKKLDGLWRASEQAREADRLRAEIAALEAKAKPAAPFEAKPTVAPADAAQLLKLRKQLGETMERATREQEELKAIKERIKKVEKAMPGVTLDHILNGEAYFRLIGDNFSKNAADALGAGEIERRIIRRIRSGQDDAYIARGVGADAAKVAKVRADYQAEVKKRLETLGDDALDPEKFEFGDRDGTLMAGKAGALSAEERAQRIAIIMARMGAISNEEAKVRTQKGQARKRRQEREAKASGQTVATLPSDIDAKLDEARDGRAKRFQMDIGEDGEAMPPVFDPGSPQEAAAVSRAMQAADGNWFDMAYEAWINSILSGPLTQAANITGNASNAAWELSVKRFGEALLNLAVKSPDAPRLGEFKWMLRGLQPALARAWSDAVTSFDTEVSNFTTDTLDTQLAIDEVEDKTGGVKVSIPGKTGRVVRIPGRLLMATDAFFKTVIANIHVASEAYRSGMAQGLKGSELATHIEKESKAGSASWGKAVQLSRELTFQDDHKGTAMGSLLQNITKLRETDLGGGFKPFRFIAPFIRTPFNIFQQGLRQSPAGSVLLAARMASAGLYALRDGKPFARSYPTPQLIKHTVEQVLAWAALGALYGMAAGDEDDADKDLLITGSMTDKRSGVSQLNQRAGVGPYTLRIGGAQVKYGRIEPLATMLGTAVDMLTALKGGNGAFDSFGNFMASAGAAADEKTFLRGWTELTEALSGETKLKSYVAQQVATAVPNLFRQTVRNLDPNVRQSGSGFADTLAGSVFSPSANPKIDVYGQPVEKPGAGAARLAIPAEIRSTPELNRVDRMLMKWNAGMTPEERARDGWAPQPPARKFKVGGDTVELSADAYEKYARRTGEIASRLLAGVSLNVDKPTKADVQKVKNAFELARSQARREVVGARAE